MTLERIAEIVVGSAVVLIALDAFLLASLSITSIAKASYPRLVEKILLSRDETDSAAAAESHVAATGPATATASLSACDCRASR
jgi:hypothetical protein